MEKVTRLFGRIAKLSLQYACIMHCTFEYVGDFVVCNGPSMEPTLYSQNILLTERITKRFRTPRRGDIIIAVSPLNPYQHICKRIVGVPGDKIITTLAPSVKTIAANATEIKTIEEYVPYGHVWLEGDNSPNSADSRYFGAIPLGLIKSRVILRFWPLSELTLL